MAAQLQRDQDRPVPYEIAAGPDTVVQSSYGVAFSTRKIAMEKRPSDLLSRPVSGESLRSLEGQLEAETDPPRRSTLFNLLVDEENRLGFNLEQLACVDERIAAAKERVERQQNVIAQLKRDGGATKRANALLDTFRQTLALYESYRKQIMDALDKSKL